MLCVIVMITSGTNINAWHCETRVQVFMCYLACSVCVRRWYRMSECINVLAK